MLIRLSEILNINAKIFNMTVNTVINHYLDNSLQYQHAFTGNALQNFIRATPNSFKVL